MQLAGPLSSLYSGKVVLGWLQHSLAAPGLSWRRVRRSHVVDLGHLVVVGLLNEAVRHNVAFDLADTLHLLHVARNLFVLSEELVVSKPLDEVAQLEHLEVQESQVVADQELSLAHVVDDWLHLFEGCLLKNGAILPDVAGTRDGALHVLQLRVHHVDFSSLLRAGAEELGGVGRSDVDHDSVGVRDLRILIDQVRDRGEVKTQCVPDISPALDGEIRRVSLLIHDILVGVLRVLEQVPDRLGLSTDLPVAQLDWRVLGVLLLPASSGVGGTTSILFRILRLADSLGVLWRFLLKLCSLNSLVLSPNGL